MGYGQAARARLCALHPYIHLSSKKHCKTQLANNGCKHSNAMTSAATPVLQCQHGQCLAATVYGGLPYVHTAP